LGWVYGIIPAWGGERERLGTGSEWDWGKIVAHLVRPAVVRW
jgi:hypothetical protein